MLLYLMRHGPAVDRGDPAHPDDAARPLTPQGRRKTPLRPRMRSLGVELDLVISSPLVRARETAEIVAQVLRVSPDHVRETHTLEPGFSRIALLEELGREPHGSSVLLVGHEPDLGELASHLIAGDAHGVEMQFKKGALCLLESEEMPPIQRAKLRFLIQPRQLRAAAAARKNQRTPDELGA